MVIFGLGERRGGEGVGVYVSVLAENGIVGVHFWEQFSRGRGSFWVRDRIFSRGANDNSILHDKRIECAHVDGF